jgi:hypothetical protein
MLMPAAADDAEFQTRVGAFLEGLQQAGWTILLPDSERKVIPLPQR